MKVLIITNIPSPYRVIVFDEVAKVLGDNFIAVYCAGNHPSINWEKTTLKHKHIFLDERVYMKGEKFIPLNKGVFKVLRENNPDAVITCGFNPTMLKAIAYCFLYRKKRMVNTDSWELNEKGYTFLHILLRKILYKFTHAFLPIGIKGVHNYRRYGIKKEKIFVSNYAVDNEYYAKFIDTPKKYDVMFSGQIIDRKMPFFFCDVVEELIKYKKDLKVLVLGNGVLREQILHRLDEIKADYHYPGFIQKEELPGFYASSRIFLFPTRIDSWGVVANDACAVGTPVITCENAGAAGDLIIDGYNGFVLPLDVKEWVEHILRLLNNKEQYNFFSKNALDHIKNYSAETAANGIIKAINNVM